jgi:methionyl aminopeptidase
VDAQLKTPAEIELMRASGRVLARVLRQVAAAIAPGVSTAELDAIARTAITAAGGRPSFLGYTPEPGLTPFPGSVCASVNDVVIHGIPGPRVLADGDVVTIDCGVLLDGWHSDSAVTVAVGATDLRVARLLGATQGALDAAVAAMQPGNRLGDIGAAIQERVTGAGFAVIPELGGHGIGRSLRKDPQVPNYGERGQGLELIPGMVLAVEPIVTTGAAQISLDPDGWTVRMVDGAPTAHSEHTIAVTQDGPLVLTAD